MRSLQTRGNGLITWMGGSFEAKTPINSGHRYTKYMVKGWTHTNYVSKYANSHITSTACALSLVSVVLQS